MHTRFDAYLEQKILDSTYLSKLSFCQNDSSIGGSFLQKDSYDTMTLLQGPKDPVLPTLIQIFKVNLENKND